uniref:Uncharacterized protein n=1 Tax=Physcomitrium patens TaxID=3218 RepID=A0A2K1KTX5_PHYPA|nr:hypothetical protein PHYPA_004230 [Physcomitrium patens]
MRLGGRPKCTRKSRNSLAHRNARQRIRHNIVQDRLQRSTVDVNLRKKLVREHREVKNKRLLGYAPHAPQLSLIPTHRSIDLRECTECARENWTLI